MYSFSTSLAMGVVYKTYGEELEAMVSCRQRANACLLTSSVTYLVIHKIWTCKC